jgi:hypothetical protein
MLNREEGYQLLKKLINHWSFNEYVIENEREIIDEVLSEHGGYIYESVLKWEKGASREDKANWIDSISRYRVLHLPTLEDVDQWEINDAAVFLFEVIFDLIRPFVNREIPLPVFSREESIEQVRMHTVVCPNCGHKDKRDYRQTHSRHTCYSCNIIGELPE